MGPSKRQSFHCKFTAWCVFRTDSSQVLDSHYDSAHARCPPCNNRVFVNKSALAQHCVLSPKHLSVTCKKCFHAFTDSSAFGEHRIQQFLVTCLLCEQYSATPADLKDHLQSAKCTKLHGLTWCDECQCFEESVRVEGIPHDTMLSQDGEVTDSKGSWDSDPNNNMNPHQQEGSVLTTNQSDGTKDIKCPVCVQSCNDVISLALHLISTHGDNNPENGRPLLEQLLAVKAIECNAKQSETKKGDVTEASSVPVKDADSHGSQSTRTTQHPDPTEVSGEQRRRTQLQNMLYKNAAKNAASQQQAAEKLAKRLDQKLFQLEAQLKKDPFDEESRHFQVNTRAELEQLKREREKLGQKLGPKHTEGTEPAEYGASEVQTLDDEPKHVENSQPAEQPKIDEEKVAGADKPGESLEQAKEAAPLKSTIQAREVKVVTQIITDPKRKAEFEREIALRQEQIDEEQRKSREIEEARMAEERNTFLSKLRAAQKELEEELETIKEARIAANKRQAEIRRLEEEKKNATQKEPTQKAPTGELSPDEVARKQQASVAFRIAVHKKVAELHRTIWGPAHKLPEALERLYLGLEPGDTKGNVKVKDEPASAKKKVEAIEIAPRPNKENVKLDIEETVAPPVKVDMDHTAILAKIAAIRAEREAAVNPTALAPTTPEITTTLGSPFQAVDAGDDDTASDTSDLITF